MPAAPAKIGVLVFYGAALLSLFLDFPPLLESVLQIGTLVLLAVHAVEVLVCLRWVKMYEGPLLLSILFTLLFGFVHWMPYKKRFEGSNAA
jgi:uncharacterized protein YhhL (DUF1145 family)